MSGDKELLVIPASAGLRESLLGEVLDIFLAGHLGVWKCLLAL